jgi:protein-S-isoprenylcysteine O-methyltransferase Ste14
VQPPGHQGLGHDRVIAWIFVLVQLGLLAAVLLIPSGSDWTAPGWLSTSARILSIFGLLVVGVGLINLGRSATPLPTPKESGEFRSSGLYHYVRHPIYSGLMALAIGLAIPSGKIVVAAAAMALVVWLAIKARWEEHRLSVRYPEYSSYATRTPRFIPSLRKWH